MVERHHPAAVMAAAVVMAIAAAGMRTETEAGAEDHGDDENAAGGNADPREHLHQPARLVLGGRGCHGLCCRCSHGLRRRIMVGGCFSHDTSMRALLRCRSRIGYESAVKGPGAAGFSMFGAQFLHQGCSQTLNHSPAVEIGAIGRRVIGAWTGPQRLLLPGLERVHRVLDNAVRGAAAGHGVPLADENPDLIERGSR